jgi:hypothetical protein
MAPVVVIPVRSMILAGNERIPFEVELDQDCSEWPIIVVIDHPINPQFRLPVYDDAVVFTLRDWQQLNLHLRSVHELLRYVKQILEYGQEIAVPLGHEFTRFASVVEWEAAAKRHPRAKPWTSFEAVQDPAAIESYRSLIERTWGDNDEIFDRPIEDYRAILDYLDDAPASAQVGVGRFLVEKRAELKAVQHRVSGSALLVDRPIVLLSDLQANKVNKKLWVSELWGLTVVRAIEWEEQMRTSPGALGVGIRLIDGEFDEYSFIFFFPGVESLFRLTFVEK